ncbi:hypothetical protein [Halorussus halophilus]|uniref:hypothetical protein n=1 Tax=Halorussus halophilus TaxID=2650975 RepID=UPI001CE47DA0|nr:hypothetical protein [Halorussus halophilus]
MKHVPPFRPDLDCSQLTLRSPRSFIPKRRPILTTGALLLSGTAFASTPVAAQQQVGSDICGTPLADTINFAAPLFVGILMISSAILAYILHNAAALPKNPDAVEGIKNWRNRAAFSTVTTPLFAVVIQLLIQSTGVGLTDCVNIIPFF